MFEDEQMLCSMYEAKYKLDGLDVATYNNPSKDPVSIVLKENPDVISMSITMPKMNGFDAIKLLKADTRTKDIPIIILSNLGDRYDVDKGLALGAVDYLVKSQHLPSEVVNRFRKLLGLPQHIPVSKEANKTLLRSDSEFIPPLSGTPTRPVKKPRLTRKNILARIVGISILMLGFFLLNYLIPGFYIIFHPVIGLAIIFLIYLLIGVFHWVNDNWGDKK